MFTQFHLCIILVMFAQDFLQISENYPVLIGFIYINENKSR